MFFRLFVFAAAALLSGCALTSQVLVGISGDPQAYTRVAYRGLGFTVELRSEDAAELRRMREKAAMFDQLVRAAQASAQSQPTH